MDFQYAEQLAASLSKSGSVPLLMSHADANADLVAQAGKGDGKALPEDVHEQASIGFDSEFGSSAVFSQHRCPQSPGPGPGPNHSLPPPMPNQFQSLSARRARQKSGFLNTISSSLLMRSPLSGRKISSSTLCLNDLNVSARMPRFPSLEVLSHMTNPT